MRMWARHTDGTSGWRTARWAAIAALLLLPLIAMQFTREVAWDVADFIMAGGLLIGAEVIYEIAAGMTRDNTQRVVIGGALMAAVAIVWAQSAVGIF
ncbi:hypothetical protein C1T17_04940 [Sphingobium sp. SCG-1]|uniref:hypothetical protein n=1 Tax=Sphingobium sp. SCG-1 TaxID=2072936 RepID=UPI000CD69C63|nr:hypothetical protein [Sphingobium sp. SCG-1]AUW57546.1 hypothetical protein C1T17_04940 [Sphingobium sp. SCG-1]